METGCKILMLDPEEMLEAAAAGEEPNPPDIFIYSKVTWDPEKSLIKIRDNLGPFKFFVNEIIGEREENILRNLLGRKFEVGEVMLKTSEEERLGLL